MLVGAGLTDIVVGAINEEAQHSVSPDLATSCAIDVLLGGVNFPECMAYLCETTCG